MTYINNKEWSQFVACHPETHILQTVEWGELKSKFGWRARHVVSRGGVQVLFRKLPLGLSLAYIPKGPVAVYEENEWLSLLSEIDQLCREERAVFLKLEPDAWVDTSPMVYQPRLEALFSSYQPPQGFIFSPQSIQPRQTLVIALGGEEEEILSKMKSKTRYNIRLAQRRGVKVETSQNLEIFNKLMQITSERDQFGIHSSTYYQTCYDLFSASGKCELLVAEYQGLPLASIMIFRHGKRAWYFYGASSNEHREYMATYLLQWEAIRWARSQECISYDLWGVPDEDEVSLELNFNKRTDGLWGVYRFKRGFGGTLNRAAGPWDRVYLAPFYAFYRMISQRKNILN